MGTGVSVAATLPREAAGGPWDVLVVGAGPAGAVVARCAAADGLRTLLVDRNAFPRDKVCGGCLSARTLARLADAGLLEPVQGLGGAPLTRLRLAAARRRVELPLPVGMALSRRELDAALLRAAINSGVHFLPQQRAALGPLRRPGREVLLHDGERQRVARASVVVDASGLAGALIGAPAPRARRGARLGCAAILEEGPHAYRSGVIHMAVGAGGYVGLVRLEDGRLNVAAALDGDAARHPGPGATVARILQQAGLAPLAGIERQRWSGTPRLSRRPPRCATERLFALGDAAGYAEPFTGEGIGWALHSAQLLAPLLAPAAHRWSLHLAASWNAVHTRELARAQRPCRMLARWLQHPHLVRGALRLLQLRPSLGAPLVRHLHAAPPTEGGAAWL